MFKRLSEYRDQKALAESAERTRRIRAEERQAASDFFVRTDSD